MCDFLLYSDRNSASLQKMRIRDCFFNNSNSFFVLLLYKISAFITIFRDLWPGICIDSLAHKKTPLRFETLYKKESITKK